MSEELARSHPANGYYRHLVGDTAYSLASFHYHERHDADRARIYLEKALEIEQQLAVDCPRVGEYGFYLGNILRDFRDWLGDTARLSAIGDRFTALIQDHESRFPPEKRDRARLDHCSFVPRGC